MPYQLSSKRYFYVSGLTLVELLVTVVIVGVLTVIAIPNFQSMIQTNRIQSAAAEFQAGLALARSEAIKHGGDARVTILANSYSGSVANWNSGFSIFYDTTTNAGGYSVPNGATVLMKTAATNDSIDIKSNAPGYVSFNGLGRSILSSGAIGPASFSVGPASGAGESSYRCIILSATGRTRSEKVSYASFTDITSCTAL